MLLVLILQRKLSLTQLQISDCDLYQPTAEFMTHVTCKLTMGSAPEPCAQQSSMGYILLRRSVKSVLPAVESLSICIICVAAPGHYAH